MRFFALVQGVFLGKRGLLRHLPAKRNPREVHADILEGVGFVTRRTLEYATFAPPCSEHVLRKVKQLKRLAALCTTDTWRTEHALRLCCAPCQSCYDDAPPNLPMPTHELPGSHWRVLGARPHCKVASPRTRDTIRVSTSFHRFLASLFQGLL